MVGNDVIDLLDGDADLTSYSERFLERAFTGRERCRIEAARDPALCTWRHWAAKEAAWKAMSKTRPSLIFSPSLLEVEAHPTDPDAARVRSLKDPALACEIRFLKAGSSIHALAQEDAEGGARVVHACERFDPEGPDTRDPGAPSRIARRLVCRSVAAALGIDAAQLEVRRQGRVPVLFRGSEPLLGNLSIAHHGRFTGFAFETLLACRTSFREAG
ncbi:MAG: 4'-phosphopantetheinyl transferase superfamily protein [Myxococcota bacterium]